MAGRVAIEGSMLCVESSYNPDLVEAVKSVIGRRWDAGSKRWLVPLAQAAALKAISSRFALAWPQDADTAGVRGDAQRQAMVSTSCTTVEPDANLDLKGFVGVLRPYQKAGVAYLLAAKRSIQADDMGLGKTAQALAALEADDAFPALVVAPASLVLNWRSEASKWLPHRAVQVIRSRKDGIDLDANIVVITYDLAKSVAPTLTARGFKAVIADEAHYLKNSKSKRTVALSEVVRCIPRAHLLTGTPITNRPADLIAPLDMLGHLNGEFGGWFKFASRYCQAYCGDYGWDVSGAAHLEELNERLRSVCLVRRTKSQVLAELPPKQRTLQPVELANRGEYNAYEREFVRWLDENSGVLDRNHMDVSAASLTRLNQLKQLAGLGKVPAAQEAIENTLETGRKVVVFAHHRAVLDALQSNLAAGSFVRIDGATNLDARQEAVERFQGNDDCRVFLASTKAAGVGLTLTAASDVLIVEQEWVPADLDQAEDRCHRIGQTQCVNAVHLIAEDTVDEKLLDVVNRLRAIAVAAINGTVAPDAPLATVGGVLVEVLAAYRTASKTARRRPPRVAIAKAA